MFETIAIVALASLLAISVGGLLTVRSRRDPVVLLTLFLIFLFGINARWVLPGGGAVATPAMVIAAAAAWWWWMARLTHALELDRRLNPVRVALLVYLWFICLSWGLAYLRPLSPLEVNGSNRVLITTLALTGIALLCADGIRTRGRLDTLVRRIVIGGTFLSAIGILQFFVGLDLVALARFPGLVINSGVLALASRSDFRRAEGTAHHSIEFSVVLAMVLPLAIHLALHAADTAKRRRYTLAGAIIAVGIPLSVSRSGVLAVAVALLVLSLAWTWRQRVIGFLTTITGTVLMYIAVPGLIGTLRGLFRNVDRDSSVTARLDRFPLAFEQVSNSPWFGSGVGTFFPGDDFLLDNQLLGTLIETGIVGLVVVLALFGMAMVACYWVRRRAQNSETGHLAQAIMAGIAVLPTTMATFDAFFYRILMGVAFLLIGCSGVLWRLVVRDRNPVTVSIPASPQA